MGRAKNKAVITIAEADNGVVIRCDFLPSLNIANPCECHEIAAGIMAQLHQDAGDGATQLSVTTVKEA